MNTSNYGIAIWLNFLLCKWSFIFCLHWAFKEEGGKEEARKEENKMKEKEGRQRKEENFDH